jgi:hypothetical protein
MERNRWLRAGTLNHPVVELKTAAKRRETP